MVGEVKAYLFTKFSSAEEENKITRNKQKEPTNTWRKKKQKTAIYNAIYV